MNIAAKNSFFPQSFSASTLSKVDQEFRQWLHQRGFWSENAERLFLYLSHNQHVPLPITSQQKQLLVQVIEDAFAGINITERYPAFFRDLLHNAILRREFMNKVSQTSQS
jgi:hypothetical protein